MPLSLRNGRFAAALWFLTGTVQAHGVRPDIALTLEPVKAASITVQLHQGQIAPQLVIENRGVETLEILDANGRAFLRIGPRQVEADVNSDEWNASLNPVRTSPVAPARPPRWRVIRKTPTHGWFDSRLDAERVQIPKPVVAVGRPVPLQDWRIAARLSGKPFELRGQFHYVPPAQGGVQALLTTPQPLASGVTLQVAPGRTPALLIQNRSRGPVRVLDAQGGVMLEVPAGKTRSWVEPRLRYSGAPPADPEKVQTLDVWRLPLIAGGKRVELQGEYRWIPATTPR